MLKKQTLLAIGTVVSSNQTRLLTLLSYTTQHLVQESPLPLTDPRDTVAQRMLNIP